MPPNHDIVATLVARPSSSSHFPQLTESVPTSTNEPKTKPLNYGKVFNANVLESSFVIPKDIEPIPLKSVRYDGGVTTIEWTEAEVTQMNKLEYLQYAIVGKFVQG